MTRASSGEGMAAITLAKAGFLATRTVYFLALPHLLHSPAEYGNLSLVLAAVMVACAGLTEGTMQSVSTLVAGSPARAGEIRSAALAASSWIALAAGALLVLSAGPLARLFGGDPSLVPLFRLGALTVAAHLFFSVYLGLAAGLGRYRVQAALDLFVSVSKLLLVVGLAAWAGTALWALGGFTLSQFLGVALAAAVLGLFPWRGGFSKKAFFEHQGGMVAFSLVLNFAVRSDLFILKALAPGEGSAELAGYYGAAQVFASVPAALAVSVNLVLLPLVAASRARGEEEEARSQIRGGLLLALLALVWSSVIFSSNAAQWISLVYPGEYQAAAPVLEVLVFGGALYTVFLICSTLLAALSSARGAITLAAFYLGAIYSLGAFLVPKYLMMGAAWTHALSGLAVAAAGLFFLWKAFGAALPARALAVLAAGGAAWALPRVLPGGAGEGPWSIFSALFLRAGAQSALFAGLCWALGVFSSRDLGAVLGHNRIRT